MANKNTFLKVMGIILLIQGVLQLVNVAAVLTSGNTTTISMAIFYVSLLLTTAYGFVALGGGLIAVKDNREYKGCKRCFACGVTLLVLNVIMLILNMALNAFDPSQFGAFVIPALFTAAAILGGRR